jgi:hypothetical protein
MRLGIVTDKNAFRLQSPVAWGYPQLMDAIQKAARALGRRGGKSTSPAKVAAARRNGKKFGGGDGRPHIYSRCMLYRAHRWSKSGKCKCGQDRLTAVLAPVA